MTIPVAQAPVIHAWGARRMHSRQRARRAGAQAAAATPAAAAVPAAAATQRLRRGVVREGKTRIP